MSHCGTVVDVAPEPPGIGRLVGARFRLRGGVSNRAPRGPEARASRPTASALAYRHRPVWPIGCAGAARLDSELPPELLTSFRTTSGVLGSAIATNGAVARALTVVLDLRYGDPELRERLPRSTPAFPRPTDNPGQPGAWLRCATGRRLVGGGEDRPARNPSSSPSRSVLHGLQRDRSGSSAQLGAAWGDGGPAYVGRRCRATDEGTARCHDPAAWPRPYEETKQQAARERREMNKRWGELANKMGTVVEDIVAPSIQRRPATVFDCGEPQYFGTRVSLTRSDDRSRERTSSTSTHSLSVAPHERRAQRAGRWRAASSRATSRVPGAAQRDRRSRRASRTTWSPG